MNSIFLIAMALFIFGCKTDPVAKPVPEIVIHTPADIQHFVMGDTIHITGTVTNIIALTAVAVHMTDLSSNIEFFHNHFAAGNSNIFHFDSKYPIPDYNKSSFRLEVEGTDKDGNIGSKEILILIN